MILNAFSLEGKVAVVTGCDTGLGQGMALGLAEAGCDIVGINIVEPTETIARVTALGRRFLSLTADLRQIDGIPALLERAAAKHFIAQGNGGKIINIASMLSFQGGIRVPSYTASKSGVMGITRLMANEWAKHNINVNAIAPGYMSTNNTQQLRADAQRSAEILDRIPAGRWGLPGDLMGPVVFLASSAADYINGYTIAVDGGWLAR
ncbi:TPA: SDR family oxidoreductase [Salmonella enterica subsp. enterica serovar Infantis]|nr:SDR family oxidoreductase [Salmonella enterica subsp. enterica serovar Infantis]HCJ0429898.1 SDR family oxidoreductase [Salmonella enterica subsp. enterica serovar Infantis]